MFILLFGLALAGVDVDVKNKTSIEFNIYKNYKPYIANEITFGRSGFSLEDPRGDATMNKNKITFGFKYSDTDWVVMDPHWYIEHSRDNYWKLVHGPELRFDVRFW